MTAVRPSRLGLMILSGCLISLLVVSLQVSAGPLQTSGSGVKEQQILKDAQGALADKNLDLARRKAEEIRDVPGSVGEQARDLLKYIGDISNNDKKRQSALLALRRNNFEEACSLLLEIEAAIEVNSRLVDRYTNLESLKEQAGGCVVEPPPEPSISIKASPTSIEEGQSVTLTWESTDATEVSIDTMGLVEPSGDHKVNPTVSKTYNAKATGPGGSVTAQARVTVKPKQVKPPVPATPDSKTPVGKSARDLKKEEELKRLEEARQQEEEERRRIEEMRQREDRELRDALADYYSGKYEQAYGALKAFLNSSHSVSITAFARFYAGAALGSKYYLSGGSDDVARNTAIQYFQQVAGEDPSYVPRWDALSPRIKELFMEATR